MASFDPSFTAAVSHLELLGFTPAFDEIGASLTHANRPNLRVYHVGNRLTCLAPFVVTEVAKADIPGFCEFLNRLNGTIALSKFYLFEGKTMMVQASYVGAYEKIAFGTFFDTFLDEVWQPRSVDPAAVKKFLG